MGPRGRRVPDDAGVLAAALHGQARRCREGRSAAGEVRWIETNKVPLRDLSGTVIGVLGTFEDVTERRVAEDNLQRTLNELDERVKRRTTQLMRANESLRREVEDRVRIQAEERQQRSYAEALSDSAAAMSSTDSRCRTSITKMPES